MARNRCGCTGSACGCLLEGGTGIDVTGSGTVDDPYIIDGTGEVDVSGAVIFEDTRTVDFTTNGSGTENDPLVVSAEATLEVMDLADVLCDTPDPNDVLAWNGNGWVCVAPTTAPVGEVVTADPVTGDGTAADPITTDIITDSTMSGKGTEANPLTTGIVETQGLVDHGTVYSTEPKSRISVTLPADMFSIPPVIVTGLRNMHPQCMSEGIESITTTSFISTVHLSCQIEKRIRQYWRASEVIGPSELAEAHRIRIDETPVTDTNGQVTCPRDGCTNNGVPIEVVTRFYDEEEEAEESVDKIVCGVCGTDVTDTLEAIPVVS